MRNIAFSRDQTSGLGVLGVFITCVQSFGLSSAQYFKLFVGYKSVSFTMVFTNTLHVVTHRFFYEILSFISILIPTIHTTNKGNYKTYKLITC